MITLTAHRNHGPLHREEWRFYLKDGRTVLIDSYEHQARPSARHKFKTLMRYSRLRHNVSHDVGIFPREEVPLSPEIVELAFRKLAGELRVCIEHGDELIVRMNGIDLDVMENNA